MRIETQIKDPTYTTTHDFDFWFSCRKNKAKVVHLHINEKLHPTKPINNSFMWINPHNQGNQHPLLFCTPQQKQ